MARPDYAHKMTDAQLAELERRIAKLYKEAADELTNTVKAYFGQFEKRDAAMKEKLDAGEITEQHYKQWRLAQIGRGKRFVALRDKVAERYTNANKTAIAYVNDKTPGIYSLNRNFTAYTIEKVCKNVDFTLFDERTVKRLIVKQPDLMPHYPPERAVQRGIDLKYGKQQITASVTSSILQGKSIGKIADDLQSRIQDMNRVSAIRAARTATTAAECAGRLDSYLAAKDMGIGIRQEWVATLDGRTRHAHAAADGQVVDVDKPFVLDGYHLMYPGDSSAPGYLVYNCRCTTVAVLDGVDTGDAMRRARDPETGQNVLVEDMNYDEWVKWKKSEQSIVHGVGSNVADIEYIKSDDYREKFNALSDDKRLNSAIYKYCKAAIIHQSGSYREDLTIITESGNFVGQTTGRVDNETHYTEKLKEAVSKATPYTLVSIHNHGTNIPPSGSDFTSAGLKKYAFGVVACHNGDVYVYSSKNARPFVKDGFDKRVDKYIDRGYNILEACNQALNEAAVTYGIEWRRL